MINFVFFGTDEFAVVVLEELKRANLLPSLIITAPDQPKGRKLILTPPPVKIWAQENKIDFTQPPSLKNSKTDPDLSYKLKAESWQLFIVASYGKIIPQTILDLPKHGTLNVHPSLLPKYRGPSPIQTAMLNGDKETGVTIMLLDEQVDHGPIIAATSFQLSAFSNYPELRDKLGHLGGKLLSETMPDWVAGKIKAREQDHSQATFTKMIEKSDGEIKFEDIENKPQETYRKFLAYTPWPGIYFFKNQRGEECAEDLQRIKITEADFVDGKLTIKKVIPAGGKAISWSEYQRDY